MRNGDRLGGHAQFRFALAVAALALLGGALGGTAPAAANGVKRVACALPYVQSAPNFFCSDLHQILFFTDGYTSNTDKIVAELLAMDADGNVLSSMPVHAGDYARMTSNTQLPARITQKRNLFSINAPIAVLHVTADDGVTKKEAFCSNIPILKVLQPDNNVVSVSDPQDDKVHVLAAIPLVDPSKLVVLVDGADIFALLGVSNPSTCSFSSPCGGPVTIGGHPVTISNLIVDSAAIHQYAANTVSFDAAGLGCGGHAVFIDSDPRSGARTRFVSPSCHTDPIKATAFSSGFAITAEKPLNQQTGLTFPVQVKGEVCSGRPISVFVLNGQAFDVDPGALTMIPGNGTTTADTYKFAFDVNVPKTNVQADVTSGVAGPGTFDPGTNRLVLGAFDDVGNRTFLTRYFGTGMTLNTGINPSAAGFQAALAQGLVSALAPVTQEVDNAFAIGLSVNAIKQQIAQRCAKINDPNDPDGFPQKVLNLLWPDRPNPSHLQKAVDPCPPGVEPGQCGKVNLVAHFDPPCSCAVNAPIWITSVDLGGGLTCTADFDTDVIHVKVTMPDITAHIEISHDGKGTPEVCGQCSIDPTDSKTILKATTSQKVSGASIAFDITKDSILTGNPAPPPACPGATGLPDAVAEILPKNPKPGEGQRCVNKGTRTPDPPVVDRTGSDIPCFFSGFCLFGAWLVDGLVNIITFGQVNLDLLSFDFSIDPDLTTKVALANPEPFGLNKMEIDPEKVKNHNQELSGKLSSVKINSNGLLAGLKGSFATLAVDPDVQGTPGASITLPPLPTLPVAGGKDIFVALSTDSLNMLNAGMTVGGALKTSCQHQKNKDGSTMTLGDLLPHSPAGCKVGDVGCHVDCEALVMPELKDAALAAARGVCHGVNLEDCETLTDATPVFTGVKQGACHATQQHNCNSIPVPAGLQGAVARIAEQAACKQTPQLNLRKDQPILMCTRQDIPPTMIPLGSGGTAPVEGVLRLKALSVGLVIDRDNVGSLTTSLADTPPCSPDSPKSGQCVAFEGCLDANINFNMRYVPPSEVATCDGTQNVAGNPGIKFVADHVKGSLFLGVLCKTTANHGTTDLDVVITSHESKAVDLDIPTAAQEAAPPLCMKGLDLNKIVKCDDNSTGLVTIETNGDPTQKDWLGVSCSVTP